LALDARDAGRVRLRAPLLRCPDTFRPQAGKKGEKALKVPKSPYISGTLSRFKHLARKNSQKPSRTRQEGLIPAENFGLNYR
jgi:hypothetical protein